MVQARTLAALVALSFAPVHGLNLNVDSTDSIKSAASTIASGMVSYYHGNESGEVPGLLPSPYYWWEGGGFFDALIQYWRLTGDTQYNSLVSQGIQFQEGDNNDFMPANQTKSEGNDDQSVWALAAMSAAEMQFPGSQNGTSWSALAEAVFNEQVARWDSETCGGGLRWQIFPFNNGYNYKNTLANGNFFQLASRLARYTGNSTYSDWASKSFSWATTVGFIDSQWNVYDGASTDANCSAANHVQFSNSAATYISGAAHMFNVTNGGLQWKVPLDGLLNRTLNLFFPDGVANEIACENHNTCDLDMQSFRGFLAHALVDTIQVAPYTAQSILPKLTSTAQAAASACNGGVCPMVWSGTSSSNDSSGIGQQLSALSFVQGLLIKSASSPVTGSSGGSNTTPTATGSSNGTQTSSTSSGSPKATNAGVVVGAETARMGILAAGLGSIALLIL